MAETALAEQPRTAEADDPIARAFEDGRNEVYELDGKRYTVHPATALFPLLEGAEFESLVDSIRERGVRHPVLVRGSEIVDEAVSSGGLPTARSRPRSPAVAPDALGELAACLDDVPAFARAQPAISAPADPAVGVVESWYRRACVSQLQSSSFDAFVAAYGERSRARVEAILAREEDLAAELLAGAGGAVLDPDLVWEAALGRSAAQLRAFGNDLVAVLGGFESALGVAGERDRCGGRRC